ncbi:hypothetical protein MTO96_031247 [Rhipicephalus appendiculatus]
MQLIDAVTVVKVDALGSDEVPRDGPTVQRFNADPDTGCFKAAPFIPADAPVFDLRQAQANVRAKECPVELIRVTA